MRPVDRTDRRLLVASIVSKGVFAGGQFIATLIVVNLFGIEEQAIYFVFLSILSTQFLFELGLNQVLIVRVATSQGSNFGKASSFSESEDVVKYGARRYAQIAIGFLAVSIALGSSILSYRQTGLDWGWPWVMACLAATARFVVLFLEAVIEGRGEVMRVLVVRSVSQSSSLLTFLVTALSPAPLFAVACGLFVSVFVAVGLYRRAWRPLFAALRSRRPSFRPVATDKFGRNVSVTWLSSFIISNAPIPLVFTLGEPLLAAKLGVALQFSSVIGVVAGALSAPFMARAAALAAEGSWDRLSEIRRTAISLSVAVALATAISSVVLLALLPTYLSPSSEVKLPTVRDAVPFILAALAYAYMAAIGLFYRANRAEIFARPLALCGVVTLASYAILSHSGSLFVVGLGAATPALIIMFPLVVIRHAQLSSSMASPKPKQMPSC